MRFIPLFAIAALCVIAGCEDDSDPLLIPEDGDTQSFTLTSADTVKYPCTGDGLNEACKDRGYEQAIDWICHNDTVYFVTCWRP